MITRRRFLATTAAASAAAALDARFTLASASSEDNTKFVKLAIGTGGHGHTYPGATVPFGAVQLSPDTGLIGWDHCSGYHYADKSILGFSHTHLSGTGAADLLDFLIVPRTGAVHVNAGTEDLSTHGYRSAFSHSDEVSRPGYYAVLLQGTGIHAELTATERTGLHRYTFPANATDAHIILDMTHCIGGNPKSVVWSKVESRGNDTLVGGRSTKLWAPGRQVYFAMQFSQPFESIQFFEHDQPLPVDTTHSDAQHLKVVVHFKTPLTKPLLVRTGISAIDADAAASNLKSELPHWDFDRVALAAHNSWQQHLSRISIETASEKHKQIFYTALYHTMVAPTLYDDVDGRYRGMDQKIHQLSNGQHNYSTFSLWDTYRAAHPLYTLILPERVSDFVNCLIRMAHESPGGVPIWPLHGVETFCMVGYHSAPVVAEALMKSFQGIDVPAAWSAFEKRAQVDDYRGLGSYRKFGYVGCDVNDESASKTLDYSYDDWAVAHIAKAAGKSDQVQPLIDRSRSYKNLYDKETGFIRPRYTDGHWAGPFNPLSNKASSDTKWIDYTESNAWQTTFCVAHDPAGLIEMLGGREAFITKLDKLFNQSSDLPPGMPPDVAGLVGQYAHGNEPSHHIAYLYNFAGVPHKTQSRVRSLMETMYDNQPDGMAGNEDCGQMSAWFILSSLGFYPVDPLSTNYDLGSPLFDKALIRTGPATTLTIEAKRQSPKSAYVAGIKRNGQPYNQITFTHKDFTANTKFTFEMKDEPKLS